MSALSSSLYTLHIPTPWASEILRCLTKCRNQSLIKIALPQWSPHDYLCRTTKKDFMRRILIVLVISFPQELYICQLRLLGNIVKLIWIFIIRLPASPNCQKSRYKTRKSNLKTKANPTLKNRVVRQRSNPENYCRSCNARGSSQVPLWKYKYTGGSLNGDLPYVLFNNNKLCREAHKSLNDDHLKKNLLCREVRLFCPLAAPPRMRHHLELQMALQVGW